MQQRLSKEECAEGMGQKSNIAEAARTLTILLNLSSLYADNTVWKDEE